MCKKPGVCLVIFIIMVIGFFATGYFITAQDIDHTDPVKVANYALKLIIVGDVDGLRSMMHPDKKATYTPFTSEKREQLQQQTAVDKEKIEKLVEISEIRELANSSGQPTAVAKIRKKSGEVYVIALSKKDNLYYYDSVLTLGAKEYKRLTLIKKAK